jgi:hypothetical protein
MIIFFEIFEIFEANFFEKYYKKYVRKISKKDNVYLEDNDRKPVSLFFSMMALLMEFLAYMDWLYVCSSLPSVTRTIGNDT